MERLIEVGITLGVLGVVAQLGPISPVNRAVDDMGLVCSVLVLGIGLMYRARRLRRSHDTVPVDNPVQGAGKSI